MKQTRRWIGTALRAGLLSLVMQAAVADERVFDVDLPAGTLAAGASRLAAQAGVPFSVDERLVAGVRHAPLSGRFTLREAFERLLAGSGLALAGDGPAFTLRRAAPAEAAAPGGRDTLLAEIRVHAAADDAPVRYRYPSVQATRSETPLQELPQSATVLSADFIRDQAPRSLAELLRYVPGLGAAQGEGNRDTPVFRGSLSTSDFLLDGLRDDVQYYRDLYNIERVEALRGPNAATVGHGAVGGLINRIAKQPEATAFRRLAMETGSDALGRVTLDLNEPIDDTLSARLNLMLEDSGGYRDFFHLRRHGINPVLAWRVPGKALLSAGFEHFEDHRTADRGVPSWLGRPLATDPAAFFGNPQASTTWIRLNALNAQLDLDLGDGLLLQARSRLADYDKFFQNAFPGTVRQGADGLEVALLAHNSRMRRRNLLHQAELSWRTASGAVTHQWLAGIELGRQQGDNRRETGFFATDPAATTLWVPLSQPVSHLPIDFRQRDSDPDNSSEVHVAALHLQDQMRLAPHWQATLALRHDRIRLDVDDRQLGRRLASRDRLWSPRAGLLWQPDPAWSAYGNLSLGYALRAGEQLNLLTPANQSLAPERFSNRELGLRWSPRPGLDASAAVYRFERRNVAVADPAAPTQALLLVDGQRTRGLELGLGGSPRPGWQVMAAYTLQDSRIRRSLSALAPAGAAMPHVPRHGLSLWNRWALDARWSAALGLTARSGLYASTDNSVRLPGYARWDGALFYAPSRHLRVQLNVENLFDTRYHAFAHSNTNITPGAPRALRLGVQLLY
ncbi:TonB-dependent siderophore receptor [Piscinibacter sp.]|uniref:TonB-dependent siderophore receptor n=1 Tax=Piscinibacter sp. TaxID=1903157 RepID=UPI0039E4C632